MGRNDIPSVTDRYGLARVDRERRWTWIVDGVLLVVVGAWVLAQRDPSLAGGTRVAVSLALAAVLVHRGLLLVERRRRRRAAPVATLRPAARTAVAQALGTPVAQALTAPAVADEVTPPAGPQVA